MVIDWKNKYPESTNPSAPNYIAAGTKRLKNKFLWWPLIFDEKLYWWEHVTIEYVASHEYWGRSDVPFTPDIYKVKWKINSICVWNKG